MNSNIPSYDYILVSFDVTSLFTKVPINDLLNFLKPELDNNSENFPLNSDTIIELIKICVIDSKFTFNEKYYKQKFGLSMGNPLSPVLSNLYMEFFEKYILSNIKDENIVWLRYIDDVLCLWPKDTPIIPFFNQLNSLVPSIKFTYELESNNSISFLDVKIHKKADGRLYFNVYRKPTSNNSFIHYFSNQSQNVKESVFISMYLRALRVCSPQFFDNEIKIINDIGISLKYPEYFLKICFNKAKKSFYKLTPKYNFRKENILSLDYNKNLNDIKPLLNKLGINLIFTNNNTFKNILIKNSPNNTSSCIYKIPCLECEKYYIGQTSKTLCKRIKQHQSYVRSGNENSGIFNHVKEFNHKINWNHSTILYNFKDFYTRNIVESIIIKNSFQHNMI